MPIDAVVDWSHVVDKYMVMQGLADGSKSPDRDSGFSERMEMEGADVDDITGEPKDIGAGV